ncbi:MAG: LytTR family DNA-binding domain-containing protein [Pseudomonadota bacterium]
MTTALLVDDEETLSRYLARKLGELWPELEVLGSATNGRHALAMARELAPDIVFLDIQMPGLTGLQVAEQLHPEVRVVFVTAFDSYAVNAFEAAAVDYLLKPVDDDRLKRTIERLKRVSSRDQTEAVREVLRQFTREPGTYLGWVRSQQGESTELVPVESVCYFKAEGKYTSVLTATHEYLIRTSIRALEEQLDPSVFWRVHRGLIVRVAEIRAARRDLRGRYELTLRSRPEPLRTSARYGHLFRGM